MAPPPVIGIAGGRGGIGSFFARLLGDAGATIRISDRDTLLSNAEVAAASDLVLVAVPLRVTPRVLAEMAPHVRPGAALASLGSLMEPAAPALVGCPGETFLLHPLFGPGRKGLAGATLAIAPLRDGPWQDWLLTLLQGQGATLVRTVPEEHDRTMAVAQALLHGVYAALTPEIMGALPGEPLAWTSPTLRLQLALMSRILHQDPYLYGDLLALNRHAPAALDRLIGSLVEMRTAVESGPDDVTALFAAARAALGPRGPGLAAEGDEALGEG